MKTGNKQKRKTQSSIIRAAEEFDIKNVVQRYRRDNDIPEGIALSHELELKRYLILCALHPHASYGMKGPVDELWHTFVFHTKQYFEFCYTIAGRYIHHVPEDPYACRLNDELSDEEKSKIRKARNKPYADMLQAYKLIFNEDPPSGVWPDAWNKDQKNALDDGGGSSCNSHCANSCDGCGAGCNSCNGGCSGCNHCNSCGSD